MTSDFTAAPRQARMFAFLSTIGVIYFLEGLPYGFLTELLPLYLRFEGASLGQIGILSGVGIVWTLKFFWAPLVDRWGDYRRWITIAALILAAAAGCLALVDETSGSVFWTIVTIFALASATQDIAIDGFTVVKTPATLLGVVNSIRVTTYRGAIILVGGGLAIVAGTTGWSVAIGITAGLLTVLALFSLTLQPTRRTDGEMVDVVSGIRNWVNRPSSGLLLAIVLLYRIGDSAILPMIKPFWVDHGFSPAEIGTITTTVGMALTVIGAWVGGAVVDRLGLYRALLWLGGAQVASNLGYALVATFGLGRAGFYGAAMVESLTNGLATAAYLAFLMSVCDKRFAATEFALMTALYGLTRTIVGTVSGFVTEETGYAIYFWMTFFAGIPALTVLIFGRRRFESREIQE